MRAAANGRSGEEWKEVTGLCYLEFHVLFSPSTQQSAARFMSPRWDIISKCRHRTTVRRVISALPNERQFDSPAADTNGRLLRRIHMRMFSEQRWRDVNHIHLGLL